MLDAARKAVEFSEGKKEGDIAKDEKLSFAIVRLIEIIGEAAKNISEDVRLKHADIPWKDIAGTRDRLVHGYFDVDLEIIGKIIKKDLPDLIAKLEKIISASS
jgi:uncharacterized protein with HEPN domain